MEREEDDCGRWDWDCVWDWGKAEGESMEEEEEGGGWA